MEAERKERLNTFAWNILSLALVVIAWGMFANWQKSPFFPIPGEIYDAFITLSTEGDVEGVSLSSHILWSLIRILTGFGMACLTGIPLGLAMGLWPKLYNSTRAVLEPIRFIPPIAWIPMTIVLLVGFSRYAFLIWLGAFFPIFINTLLSVTRVNPVHINVLKVFGASRWYTIRNIVIPSVTPDIATGMRVGLGIAWMCIVAAEMIGGEMVGVGRLILKYAELMRLAEVIVGMLVIGVIGFIMNEIFIAVERRLFRWRAEISLD